MTSPNAPKAARSRRLSKFGRPSWTGKSCASSADKNFVQHVSQDLFARAASLSRMSLECRRVRGQSSYSSDTEDEVDQYPSSVPSEYMSLERENTTYRETSRFDEPHLSKTCQETQEYARTTLLMQSSTERLLEEDAMTSLIMLLPSPSTEYISGECGVTGSYATQQLSGLEPEPEGARSVNPAEQFLSIKSDPMSTITELLPISSGEWITESGTEEYSGASLPVIQQPPGLGEVSNDTDDISSIDLSSAVEQYQSCEQDWEETCEESVTARPLTTEQRAHAIQKIQILPSSEVPRGFFDLLRLIPELRYQVYDMIASYQTFMVTSQKARGSTFTNLSYTSRVIRQDIKNWAKTRPDLTSGLRGGFVDFNNTIFLVDFWTDRLSVPPTVIGSRFQALSVEKLCAGKLKNLCVDLTTDSQHDGPQAVLAFLRSLHGTLHEFVRLRRLTIVYDSGDESVKSDWFLQRGAEWTGEYERKEGFLRTVWRMLPAALGVCHWCYPCSCCAPSWKIECNGFDVRKGKWEVLPMEEEMYKFIVADSDRVI